MENKREVELLLELIEVQLHKLKSEVDDYNGDLNMTHCTKCNTVTNNILVKKVRSWLLDIGRLSEWLGHLYSVDDGSSKSIRSYCAKLYDRSNAIGYNSVLNTTKLTDIIDIYIALKEEVKDV